MDHPAGVREAYSVVPGLEDTSKFFQDGAHAMGRVFDLVKDTAVYKGMSLTAGNTVSASDASDKCMLHVWLLMDGHGLAMAPWSCTPSICPARQRAHGCDTHQLCCAAGTGSAM